MALLSTPDQLINYRFLAVYLGKLKMRAKKAKSHDIKLDKNGEVDCAVKRCKNDISEMGTHVQVQPPLLLFLGGGRSRQCSSSLLFFFFFLG